MFTCALMASLREQLEQGRNQHVAGAWYLNSRPSASFSSSIPMGSFRRFDVSPAPRSAIQKRTETFAAKRKRTKDYSSDSSGTEKDAGDGHVENRIYRAKGESYDYYVYRACMPSQIHVQYVLQLKVDKCVFCIQTRARKSRLETQACPTKITTTRLAPTSTRVIIATPKRTKARYALKSITQLFNSLFTQLLFLPPAGWVLGMPSLAQGFPLGRQEERRMRLRLHFGRGIVLGTMYTVQRLPNP